jgi:hypothetical protein
LLALVMTVSTVDIAPQLVTELTLTVGIGLTMMVPLPLLAQPVMPSVTVTVKLVVTTGVFVIEAVVSPSLHKKLGLPALVVTVSTVDIAPQFVTELTLTVGSGLTVKDAGVEETLQAPLLITQT